MPNAVWLADVLRGAGLKVAEQAGWKTRGHATMGTVRGVLCFTGDTLILSRRGLVPIKDVVVGDDVWTHKNRWRRVDATGSRSAALHCLRGQGHPGILTTAEHPFLAYERTRSRINGVKTRQLVPAGPEANEFSADVSAHVEPLGLGWAQAQHMMGKMWCSPSEFGDDDAVPAVGISGNERPVSLTRELMWVIGYWLGNGSAAANKKNASVTLCCPLHRVDLVEETVRVAGFACSRQPSASDTVHRIHFSSKPLARWFEEHFGKLAYGKTLPAWALGMRREWREALLNGYLAADGGKVAPTEGRADRIDAVTVSKRLAFGVKMLAQSLGYATCVYLRAPPATKEIGGRTVSQAPWWTVRLTRENAEKAHGRFVDGFFASPCRESEPLATVADVFNISVEEDHSYVADALVVHNCHHTVGPKTGNMPSLHVITHGRPGLKGPLSQLGLGRDGTFYVVAAGLSYHAGRGAWRGITAGNSQTIGIEAENTGYATGPLADPWPAVQVDAYVRGCAAIALHCGFGADMVFGHKEWTRRKIDPHSLDMAIFRREVAAVMNGGIVRPPVPKVDAVGRRTLRRGMSGGDVAALQAAIGVKADSLFGAKTESALRTFQRLHGLVADGIAGPAVWAQLYPPTAHAA